MFIKFSALFMAMETAGEYAALLRLLRCSQGGISLPGEKMRTGITTGTCAAAAAKAAVLAWLGQKPRTVSVVSPQGKSIAVAIAQSDTIPGGGQATVIKDAGDDPDITHGATIVAEVRLQEGADIRIEAGPGVGIVTKPGLAVPVGQPAINPGPRKMIFQAVGETLPPGWGAVVTVSIPQGEMLAARTLNHVLGINGGLSIIGTTGIVEPMSEEAFKTSLAPQLSVLKAQGYNKCVFVPGKIGQDIAVRCGLPAEAVVQTSNFIGYMLEQAVEYGMKQVLLFGHLGKVVKVAAGIFHTHNRIADARLETMAAYLAADGASQAVVREVLACSTTEAAAAIIQAHALTAVYGVLAEQASTRATRYVFGDLTVGTVIVSLKGDILGLDKQAREIGEDLGWNIR